MARRHTLGIIDTSGTVKIMFLALSLKQSRLGYFFIGGKAETWIMYSNYVEGRI
jgi:hypothetical protein